MINSGGLSYSHEGQSISQAQQEDSTVNDQI